MERIRINTTQNVDIEFDVASLFDRYLAVLIDMVLLGIYAMIASMVLSGFMMYGGNGTTMAIAFISIPVAFYHLICEVAFNGQSLGKNAMKIKVVRMDGGQVTFGNYLLRWMFRLVDISLSFGGIATLSILLNGKGQRLGDMAAGTTVISTKRRNRFNDQVLLNIPEDFQVSFPEVRLLTDQDVRTIKEVMHTSAKMQHNEVILTLYNHLKKTLSIESELPPKKFLIKLLKDYYYLNG